MIDESLLTKVTSLRAADRLELRDTLAADDLPVSDAEKSCSMSDWPIWKRIPTNNLPGQKSRLALNGSR